MIPDSFNPEFRRNLWLSFSTHRLYAMPALLGLIFVAAALNDGSEAFQKLYYTACGLFVFIVWFWGARNANACIVDELRDHTWDQQRMSALDPWTMTWGKLFGSTAFNWYGGTLCLAVAVISGISAKMPSWPVDLLALIAGGVMLHAMLIALNLHTGKLEMRLIQRGGLGWLVLVQVLLAFPAIAQLLSNREVLWWGRPFESKLFLLGSSLLFAACAIVAAWRVMCGALQVRKLPWAWPLFACILVGYGAGFFFHRGDNPLYALAGIGLYIACTLTYAALFTEPTDLLVWHRLRLRRDARDFCGLFEHLPLWPTTLPLAFLFALVPQPLNDLPVEPLVLALMLLRDACIVLFFTFSAHTRRIMGASLLYLAVIDLLLPFLAHAAGQDMIGYFFLPIGSDHAPWSSVLVMSLHCAVAISLLRWRLSRQAAATQTLP